MNKKYKIIYADPAWNYNGQIYERGGTQNHYKTKFKSSMVSLSFNI